MRLVCSDIGETPPLDQVGPLHTQERNNKKYHIDIPQPDGTYHQPFFIRFHLDHTGGHRHLVICCQGDSIDYGSDLVAAPFIGSSPSPTDNQDLGLFIHTHPEANAVELGLHALNDVSIKADINRFRSLEDNHLALMEREHELATSWDTWRSNARIICG